MHLVFSDECTHVLFTGTVLVAQIGLVAAQVDFGIVRRGQNVQQMVRECVERLQAILRVNE